VTIASRLLAGFAVGVLLLVLVGGYALSQIREERYETAQIVQRDFHFYQELDRVRDAQGKLVARRLSIMSRYYTGELRDNPARLEATITEWREEAARTNAVLHDAGVGTALASQDSMTAERRARYHDVAQTLARILDVLHRTEGDAERVFTAIRVGDGVGVQSDTRLLEVQEAQLDGLLSAAGVSLERAVRAGQDASGEMYEFSRRSLIAVLVMAVMVAVVVTFWTRHSILAPLNSILRAMERAGQGDLSVRATGSQRIRDELSRLAEGLNRMIDGLADIAGQSRLVTQDLDQAVATMHAAAKAQTARIERQFGAVRETTATVDEITRSGEEISRNAHDLIERARGAIDMSGGGREAMVQNARAMSGIETGGEALARNIADLSERTEAIGEIVATVTDLSERSHLLALNAAIEAAAAGEHGRSFGVVASEMKILADQSREATRHVRVILGEVQRGIALAVTLTEESSKRVAAGRNQAEVASGAIARLAGSIEASVLAFQEIVGSTGQQQVGIVQVMQALNRIEQDSLEATGGTRELDEAAATLGALSRQMLVLTQRYRV